jgi:glucose dehydrogenase
LFGTFHKFVQSLGNFEAEEAVLQPNTLTPQLIAAWIFRKCEKPNPLEPSTTECEGASFSQALKMRAAVSYHYAQDEGRGSEKWHQDHHGAWLGNPALSHTVSRYMISLQRRKVQQLCPQRFMDNSFINYELHIDSHDLSFY